MGDTWRRRGSLITYGAMEGRARGWGYPGYRGVLRPAGRYLHTLNRPLRSRPARYLHPRSTPAALSPLQSLSPLSPLYSIAVTELVDMLGPDFDFDLEIERNPYQKL